MKEISNELLYKECKRRVKVKHLNIFIDIASVCAAIVTKKGNVYFGVNVKTECDLGYCAERNAIGTMITEGEYEIDRIMCVDKLGNTIVPCGACREFLMQLSVNSSKIKIITNHKTNEYILLGDLLNNNWWGTPRWKI